MDNIVDITTGYKLDGRDSNPGRGKRVFFARQRPDKFWSPSRSHIHWVPRALSLRIKRVRLDADHSPHLVP
jgi:hypothetical protein